MFQPLFSTSFLIMSVSILSVCRIRSRSRKCIVLLCSLWVCVVVWDVFCLCCYGFFQVYSVCVVYHQDVVDVSCVEQYGIKHILETKAILFYTRYIDDILMVYNTKHITPEKIHSSINKIHPKLQHTPTTNTITQYTS
jgi:hypothetical protein